MPRRGESSTQGEKSDVDESIKKIKVVVSASLTQLSMTNYRYWAMRMKAHLDAQGLWEVVARTEMNKHKDRLALSAMSASNPETSGV